MNITIKCIRCATQMKHKLMKPTLKGSSGVPILHCPKCDHQVPLVKGGGNYVR